MTKFELWLKACDEKPRCEIWQLESNHPWKLFKLIETANTKSSNTYEYHYVNYHIWNTETGEWHCCLNHHQAYECYINKVR